ncbi:MAG: 6-phosphogluconolactonase [Jatrophihabitans sp.]
MSRAQRNRGEASLVLTGGGILESVLAAIAAAGSGAEVAWDHVDIFWGDERFVPADSADRNELPARRLLLDKVPVDPGRVHPMPAAAAKFGDDADAAARAYQQVLSGATHLDQGNGVPHFDVVLMGIGPDGHCCSLFPGQPGVYETEAAVIAVHDSPKPPPTRLSLTFPALDEANEIWFIASGSGKADAVSLALGGAGRVQVPAAGPRGRSRTLWLIDAAAAAALPAALRPQTNL